MVLLALPLAAVLGACTACGQGAPQSEQVVSTPSASVKESSAPATTEKKSEKQVEPAKPSESERSSSPKSTAGDATSQAPESSTPETSESSPTVAPLSTGDSAAGSVTVLPTAAAQFSKPTQALYTAVKSGSVKDVRKALKDGADVNAQDSAGRTPMMRAVIDENPSIAKQLLDAGSDPNAKDDYQDSPFLRASASGMTQTITHFLASGADVGATNRVGGNALALACENGQVSAVRALLKTSIDVDHVNDLGWTALHETIVLGQGTSNYVTIARMLVTNGANPNLKDQTGSDAFELASERQQNQMVNMLRQVSRF